MRMTLPLSRVSGAGLLCSVLCVSLAAACSSEAQVVTPTVKDASVDAPIVVVDAGPEDASVPVDAEVDAEAPYDGPPAFDGGPMATAQVVDLKNVASGTPVSFTVPAGTLGFHVMVQSTVASEGLAVVSIQSPSGTFVHQNAMPQGGESPTSTTIMGTVAAAQVPQGDFVGATVEPGTWKVVFQGPGTLNAKVQLQNTPDGTFHGGNLNINVYIPGGLALEGGPSVNAKGAWKAAVIRDRIENYFAAIYALYGLRNGQVRFFDIPAKYKSISDQELMTVFKESKVAPKGQSVNIFLSEVAPDGEWWGIAAGIPGAANTPGTDQSGLALASVPGADATMEGFVLAHETGHFLGLNHTTEMDGRADPLSDTPRCTDIQNGDFGACPDFTNIMFFSGAAQDPVVTSAFQRRVVQGSPMFQAFTTGTPPPAAVLAQKVPPGANARALPVPDYGRLFGHPGVSPTRAERLVLGATCGHPSHLRPRLTAVDRAEIARISSAGTSVGLLQNAAKRLLQP